MATAKADAPTIVIKRIKKGGHGHHGGSWKVAFADFATAMMAFFLLMWLMGSTTQEQKGAISEYFTNPSAVPGTSTVPSPTSINGPGGASTSMVSLGGGMELHRTATEQEEAADPAAGAQINADDAEKLAEELDKERLDALLKQLNEAIDQRESLAKFKDQILLDVTPEGVRIQIIDHERRSMFPLGSPTLEPFADTILRELATVIDNVPNRISISGHTDIRPYVRPNYSNWELSADRANAARRSLMNGGLTQERIGRVVGLASSVLLDPQTPDSPINRRISIVVMNKRTEDAINHENGSLLSMQAAPADAGGDDNQAGASDGATVGASP